MIKNVSLIQAVLARRQNMSVGRPTDPEQLVVGGGGAVLVAAKVHNRPSQLSLQFQLSLFLLHLAKFWKIILSLSLLF
jgi:hypothetical protein